MQPSQKSRSARPAWTAPMRGSLSPDFATAAQITGRYCVSVMLHALQSRRIQNHSIAQIITNS
jgi:hypothetical protein